jgi:hypothetical protein
MAAFDAHKNFGYTTITIAPTPAISGNTITVSDATVFPTVPFNCTVWPVGSQPSVSNAEIIRVTNIVGNVLTITRTQEGTAARTVLVGDQIANTITAKALTDIEALGGATSTITTTGTVTALAIPSATGNLVINANNATTLTIQGITAGIDGQSLTIFSLGAGSITFAHQNGSASAANRIICLNNVDTTLAASSSFAAAFVYDGTASRWRMESASVATALDIVGTAGETITAGQFAYLSDGSGSKNAGQWYKVDTGTSYSSITPQIGYVPGTITSGSTGLIRLTGQAVGLSSLTVGASYYVNTAGTITNTPTTQSRLVGQADSTTTLVLSPNPPEVPANPDLCQGRLTLTSGLPVTVSDVTAATTIYFAPYRGNWVSLYNGTQWVRRNFSQISVAVPASTSTNYDIFLYDNAGTVALELSAAWTSDSAIFASGTYTTTRPTQDGIPVKSTNGTAIDATRRYLGSFRTTGVSGQTESSVAKRYLQNYYNRKRLPLHVIESTNSWTYNTLTWRQARATTSNQVEVVTGFAEDPITLNARAFAISSSAVGFAVAVGEDSTTTPASGQLIIPGGGYVTPGNFNSNCHSSLTKVPALGYHKYVWLETANATGTTTFYSNSNDPQTSTCQAGLDGHYEG